MEWIYLACKSLQSSHIGIALGCNIHECRGFSAFSDIFNVFLLVRVDRLRVILKEQAQIELLKVFG